MMEDLTTSPQEIEAQLMGTNQELLPAIDSDDQVAQQDVHGDRNQGSSLSSNEESSGVISRESWSGQLGDDTEASTSSYLSELEIHSVQSHSVRLREDYVVEIPIRELDDPPDGGDRDAASHDGENEH